MNLTFALARPKGQEEYRLEGQMLQGGLLDWIKWILSWCTASKKFQEGMPLLPLGLSLRKLSRRRARFSSLLMLKGEFPVYQQWVTYNHQWCWAVCQACISLLRLPEPRAKRKTALKVKCFKEAFNWFKLNLVSWCKNQGEAPGGGSPPAFGSVSVEAIQETSEIFILTNIDGQILDYQQWLTCNHQWYWAATSCPETGT